jgi:hypothetical protein
MMPQLIQDNHRFLDEAGDTTFYGKGKVPIIGQDGVSFCFIIGMVKFKEPLQPLRRRIIDLQNQIISDPYFRDIPSINKKAKEGGYYFHATDDVPEVRKVFFDFIASVDCSFEAFVGRKIPLLYETKHNGKEAEFYADLLSHLLKNKLNKRGKLVLNIASRGKTTKNNNLQMALEKAQSRNKGREVTTEVLFNVQNHRVEPLLNVADYFCWSIHRVFERGEVRYYNFLKDQISLVVDLYDTSRNQNSDNYYSPKKPLTVTNKI